LVLGLSLFVTVTGLLLYGLGLFSALFDLALALSLAWPVT
jgi:hypothetical protein